MIREWLFIFGATVIACSLAVVAYVWMVGR